MGVNLFCPFTGSLCQCVLFFFSLSLSLSLSPSLSILRHKHTFDELAAHCGTTGHSVSRSTGTRASHAACGSALPTRLGSGLPDTGGKACSLLGSGNVEVRLCLGHGGCVCARVLFFANGPWGLYLDRDFVTRKQVSIRPPSIQDLLANCKLFWTCEGL